MKKIVICTFLIAAGAASLLSINNKIDNQATSFGFKNSYAIVLGYDKSMGEKTIKAAVIDSYFREIAANGKIVRWNKTSFPLKVFIQDTPDMPDYYREIVMSAFYSWQRASEGLVRFEIVEDDRDAQVRCYFKNLNNDDHSPIGVQSFDVKGNKLVSSTINFKKFDSKKHNLDSKQLYSSALQEIGHTLGLNGKSPSIYDVMYPIGTKFNTEITARDLKSLALLYSVIPDVTDVPLTTAEKSQLFTVPEILATLKVPVDATTDTTQVTAQDMATKLALAEELRRRAEYDKAAQEYQAVAMMKSDRRGKSEVYYEVAVMYVDEEEFDKAKSCAEIAITTDMNDLTETLPALIDYYMKRSTSAIEQLDTILQNDPYNKHAYKLLCQIYREKHHENMLNATIRKYGKTAGTIEE